MLQSELITHQASGLIVFLYRLLKGGKRRRVAKIFYSLLCRLEGGQYRSATTRTLLKRDYGVEIGAHSYGDAFIPGLFAPIVIVGKYVSIGKGVRVVTQNHPIDRLSTHPYFYEKALGVIDRDILVPATTLIGNDVWIGHNALILPGCNRIGHGAIVGAGSVVTKPVPDYAIAAGNPAKVIRYRFSPDVIESLLKNPWWDKPLDSIREHPDSMTCTITLDDLTPSTTVSH